ncbi:MAG: hypothetical protein COA70_07375 [Planctomycetota bacterium]|nr:MAG: hypothetical protein COA70_07375 [Planctomycetota bacterium]
MKVCTFGIAHNQSGFPVFTQNESLTKTNSFFISNPKAILSVYSKIGKSLEGWAASDGRNLKRTP